MIRADFHIHCKHSHDAFSSIEKIVQSAIENKLNVIALTDHDTIKGGLKLVEYLKKHPELPIKGIPGVERTVEGGTHVLCLGITQDIKANTIRGVMKEVKELGGITCLAHPFRTDTGFFYNKEHRNSFTDEDEKYVMENIDLVEVANSKSFFKNKEKLFKLIEKYPHIRLLASSDAHGFYNVGNAYNEIKGVEYKDFELSDLIKKPLDLYVYDRPKSTPKKDSLFIRILKQVARFARFITRLFKVFRLYIFVNTCMLGWRYRRNIKKNVEKNKKLKQQNKEEVVFKNEAHKIILLK